MKKTLAVFAIILFSGFGFSQTPETKPVSFSLPSVMIEPATVTTTMPPSPEIYKHRPFVDKAMCIFAWPGYSKTESPFEKVLLASERVAFGFDIVATGGLLWTPSNIPIYTAANGMRYSANQGLYEAVKANTLFGNRNMAGVEGSLATYELTYSYLSSTAPRWIERRFGKGWGKIARVSSIAFGMYSTEQHIRLGIGDIQLRSCYMQNYNQYRAGLPPKCSH